MLPTNSAEEKRWPGTVSAGYALAMLNQSLPKPKKPDAKRMAKLVSSHQVEQSNLQMFVNTLNAHPGNFINPDVFAYSIEQIQENLDRLSACVRDLPVLPWVLGTVSPKVPPTTATPPPPPRRRAATVPPTYLAAAATNLPRLL